MITDEEFLDRAYSRFAVKFSLDYERAKVCAQSTLGAWKLLDKGNTPEDAVDDAMRYSDGNGQKEQPE